MNEPQVCRGSMIHCPHCGFEWRRPVVSVDRLNDLRAAVADALMVIAPPGESDLRPEIKRLQAAIDSA